MDTPTITYIAAYATAATAAGTIGLAVATFSLATKTKKLAHDAEQELALLRIQAEAADRQSNAAEAALSASIRPVLVQRQDQDGAAFECGIGDEAEAPWARFWVRNIGPGVARVVSAFLSTLPPDKRSTLPLLPVTMPQVIASGECDFFGFDSGSDYYPGQFKASLERGQGWTIWVGYEDLAGRRMATYFSLSRGDDETIQVDGANPLAKPDPRLWED
jgi:hypothetical protein